MMIAEPSKALNLRCALDLMRKPGTRMIISSGTYYIVPVGGCVDRSVAAKIIAHPQVSAGEDGYTSTPIPTCAVKRRHYFRRPGFPRVALPELPGSPEFMAAYERALGGARSPPGEIGADRTKPGTVNAAIVGYYTCLAFRGLAPSSQRKRRTILERFRERHGDKQIATLPAEFIERVLNQMKPGQARNWLRALRGLLDFAQGQKFRSDNPARAFHLPKPPKTKHRRAWTDVEVAQFEATHLIGTKARPALALGLYTIQRLGDVIRMGRQHVRNGEITLRQNKTGAMLTLPIRRELQSIIDATPSESLTSPTSRLVSPTFLVAIDGAPYGADAFGKQFRRWCDEAGLPADCSFHGLRATGCTRFADAGCSTHQIAAWSGHLTLKEVERYTRAANQKRLARSAIEQATKNKIGDSIG